MFRAMDSLWFFLRAFLYGDNKEWAAAYYYRGFGCYERGDYDGAIRDCTKAIELMPNNGDFYRMRGDAYEKKGEYDRATQDFHKVSELQAR